ncbi:MAG: hypothetical protein ACREU9_06500 [Gammaproteobacteria bacterium]
MIARNKTSIAGHIQPMARIENVEIKITVRPDQERQAVASLKLDQEPREERRIYFFDNAKLRLFNGGVILRARVVKDDEDDSTVKIRPVDPKDISAAWCKKKGFKLETDSVGERIIHSASFTVPQKREEIDQVTQGRRPISKLFSNDQERYLLEYTSIGVELDSLRVLGPIEVLRWKIRRKGLEHEICAEQWRLPNGTDLLELSVKTESPQWTVTKQAFQNYFSSRELDPKGSPQTKTRMALEFLAGIRLGEEHRRA